MYSHKEIIKCEFGVNYYGYPKWSGGGDCLSLSCGIWIVVIGFKLYMSVEYFL